MATDVNSLTNLGDTGPRSGSAFILPDNNPNPIDLQRQGQQEYTYQLYNQREQRKKQLADLNSKFGEAWDVDMPELSKARQDYIAQHAKWLAAGVDFSDPTKPEWAQSQNMTNTLTDK